MGSIDQLQLAKGLTWLLLGFVSGLVCWRKEGGVVGFLRGGEKGKMKIRSETQSDVLAAR